jgi:hypothetical protein
MRKTSLPFSNTDNPPGGTCASVDWVAGLLTGRAVLATSSATFGTGALTGAGLDGKEFDDATLGEEDEEEPVLALFPADAMFPATAGLSGAAAETDVVNAGRILWPACFEPHCRPTTNPTRTAQTKTEAFSKDVTVSDFLRTGCCGNCCKNGSSGGIGAAPA